MTWAQAVCEQRWCISPLPTAPAILAGLPKVPTITSSNGGVSTASVGWIPADTATSCQVTAVRGSQRSAPVQVAITPWEGTLERGSWKLEVACANQNGLGAASATAPLVLGIPDAATAVTVKGGVSKVTLRFG